MKETTFLLFIGSGVLEHNSGNCQEYSERPGDYYYDHQCASQVLFVGNLFLWKLTHSLTNRVRRVRLR